VGDHVGLARPPGRRRKAEELLARVAEQPARGLVDGDDRAEVLLRDDDRVRRAVHGVAEKGGADEAERIGAHRASVSAEEGFGSRR
jgi:hypothetical protein